MPAPATPFASEPSVIAGYVAVIARALEHRGADSLAVLARAGLQPAAGNDPLARLGASQVTRLFALCVAETGDPYFGLSVARFIHVSNIHALGYALMASQSLWDFCQRLERYFAIVSQAAVLRVERDDAEARLIFARRTSLCGETEDAFIAFILRFMRLLAGQPVVPLRIALLRACLAGGAGPYAAEFGIAPTFDADEGLIALDAALLDQPWPGACADLAQFNDRIAAECLARLSRDDVVARVRAAIIAQLAGGACTRARLARELGLSEAALHARLAGRGTSFADLLDETRRELAGGYLAQPGLSITEIAFLLGFTDASNFARAFRRWHGHSPRAHRERMGA